MRKFLLILFSALSVFAQTKKDVRVNVPEFITQDSSFCVSAVCEFDNSNYDSIKGQIRLTSNLELQNVLIQNIAVSKSINLIEISEREYHFTLKLNEIGFKDYYQNQFLFELRSSNSKRSELGLLLEFYDDDDVVNYYSTINYDFYSKSDPIFMTPYEPQIIAGKCLEIKNSEYEISFDKNVDDGNILIEFWNKYSKNSSNIIDFINKNIEKSLFKIGVNSFSRVIINSDEYFELYKDLFISQNSWNHFVIFCGGNEKSTRIYCNNVLLYKLPINLCENVSDLKIKFGDREGINYLDGLKIWNFNSDMERVFNNQRYLNFTLDESTLIDAFYFDKNDNTDFNRSDLNIVKSDAPIISRQAELNIEIFSNFYLLEWTNKNESLINSYILEKSTNGRNYSKIHSVDAANENSKLYKYTDAINETSDLVYYRVKQINKDSSVVYSNQLKIGQAAKEELFRNYNYPNPFNPLTTITVEMLRGSEVTLKVYNLVGNKIKTLHKGYLDSGTHKFDFDGSNLPSGIYFYEIKTPTETRVHKMILAK